MKFIFNSKQYKLFLYIITFAVLFIDQILKFIFTNDLTGITAHKNYDFFWKLPLVYFLITLILLIIIFYFKKKYLLSFYKKSNFGILLMLSGIISNTIDALSKGYIIDYISFYDLFSYNIADLAICTGASILGWKIIFK